MKIDNIYMREYVVHFIVPCCDKQTNAYLFIKNIPGYPAIKSNLASLTIRINTIYQFKLVRSHKKERIFIYIYIYIYIYINNYNTIYKFKLKKNKRKSHINDI